MYRDEIFLKLNKHTGFNKHTGVVDFAQRIENNFTSTLLIGLCSMIFMHIIINMGMISGLLPVTGLPVPFISYGGSFFLTCSIGIGLINNIINNHI